MENKEPSKGKKAIRIIRNVYLYIVTMIGLITFIFGAIGVINLVLKDYVFQVNDYAAPYSTPVYPGMKAGGTCSQSYVDVTDTTGKRMITPTSQEVEECNKTLKQQQDQNFRNDVGRELAISIAQIAIGLPIWLFHWGIIQKEYRKRDDENNPA